ncbi:L domain-like protein [Dioscorea alata]|uniref:L domain-like protein n=1 Tax=Dioscorea alata TaxID=55571 RepID=A0ACB7UWJ8_DIOAL|nr:L domain-like protein [Dioscorea alata]
MDEVWERAVEAALEGQGDSSTAPRTLTLDGAVKCVHGRLPPPALLERFQSLEHLSIANVGVSSLEKFPRLKNLQRLILSDNRIASGLEFLVEAGLESLRDLDLSNNRIQFLEELAPLARLRLVSLDLYECPVTKVRDYRSRVFGMIRTLKYLDKMDADENERPESDDDEEDDEEEEEDEDPVSGEVDGDDRSGKVANGGRSTAGDEGIIDADDDEESDADEEETGAERRIESNGHHSNGFRVEPVRLVDGDEDDEEDVEDEDDEDDLGEEVDEEDGEDDDVVEVHEIEDSGDEDEDVVEDDDDEEEDVEDEDGEEEEEDVEDEDDAEPGSTGRGSAEGEIDGHEQGEEGEEDDNGEIGEEDEQGVEEREFDDDDGDGEDEEDGTEYLMQPIPQVDDENGGNDFDGCNEEDESEDDEVDDEDHLNNGVLQGPSSSSQPNKRKRDEDEDSVEDLRSSKHQ